MEYLNSKPGNRHGDHFVYVPLFVYGRRQAQRELKRVPVRTERVQVSKTHSKVRFRKPQKGPPL
eukprot:462662-Heterocapsa_arctica.AAC.1